MKNQKILNIDQRKKLLYLHRTTKNKRYADRIKAILLFDDGYNKTEISKILFIERRSIGKYINKYLKKGTKALLKDNNSGTTPKLNGKQIEELKEALRNNMFSTAKEVAEYVIEKYRIYYPQQSMVKLLKRIGFSYKKTKRRPSKADRKKQEDFDKKYKKLRENLKDDEKLYYLDAVHPQYNSMPAYAWIEKGKEKEILTNTGRQRMNINGVYSPIDHEIIYREDDSINGQSTVELYKQIEELHPTLKLIYIIRDNAKYYGSEVVKEYLKNSRIVEIKLPTYSPNLNLIERLWKLMKKKTLYNKYYSSFIDFKNAIYNFFEKTVFEDREELISLMTEKFHLVS
jgi:transposase